MFSATSEVAQGPEALSRTGKSVPSLIGITHPEKKSASVCSSLALSLPFFHQLPRRSKLRQAWALSTQNLWQRELTSRYSCIGKSREREGARLPLLRSPSGCDDFVFFVESLIRFPLPLSLYRRSRSRTSFFFPLSSFSRSPFLVKARLSLPRETSSFSLSIKTWPLAHASCTATRAPSWSWPLA